MTAAFIATLAIAILVIAVLLVRESARRRALEQARQDVASATEKSEEADRLRAAAETSAQEEIASSRSTMGAQVATAESALAELRATSRGQVEKLERDLSDANAERERQAEAAARHAAETEAAKTRIAELEAAHVAALRTEPTGLDASDLGPPAADDRDAGWRLLLARVERQWADVVNAGPDERGVLDGPPGAQLAQAVQRDLERLREEVGVQTTMASSEPISDDGALTRLLAVGEAVALLAYHSEQVLVDLRDPAIVSGQDWTGDDDAQGRLEQLAAMASAAGLYATVKVVGHSVEVALATRQHESAPDSTQ